MSKRQGAEGVEGGTFVAFLRAINTGNRRVTNERLISVFEEAGLDNVRGFQASGNIIFDATSAEGLQAELETRLEGALGYEVPVYLRSADELAALVQARPFSEADLAATAGNVQVMFLTGPPTTSQAAALKALATAEDQLVLVGSEVHWLPRTGISESPLKQNEVVKAVGPTTIRGLNALTRLVNKLEKP